MKSENLSFAVPELLAPAGSTEGLKAVISAGADAVYIGGSRFGARAYAENPEGDDLTEAISYAHLRGVKVYLTVNTLLRDDELDDLYDWLLPYYREGVDAVLVQDLGVLRFIGRHFPDLPLHASTQMNITGPAAGGLLRELNIKRIVPARELSLPELLKLKEESGLEIETFIHGALCCCYSGQCLYSSMIGGRSGNRGRCAQPCRLLYLLNNHDFDGRYSIVERKDARHYLSPKDLCGIDLLPELAKAGIASLKIEGRMKKSEYAAGVTSIYRKYLDLMKANGPDIRTDPKDRRILYDLYNRSGFTDGYYHRKNGPEMMALVKHELTAKETQARHDLYDAMRRKYIDSEKKVPLEIEAEVFTGSPLTAVFRSGAYSVTVTGSPVQPAMSSALSAERIRAQLEKTGGTDFALPKVRIFTDESSFVSISELNSIRRDGLERLAAAIRSAFSRNSEIAPDADSKKKQDSRIPVSESLSVSVLVSDENQLKEVLKFPDADLVYLESSMLYGSGDPVSAAVRLISEVKKSGKEACIAMPFASRSGHAAEVLADRADELLQAGLQGYLVRNLETLAYLRKRNLTDYITADAGLYSFNNEAIKSLKELGVRKTTAPLELNKKELFKRDNRSGEIIVYGYLPLMITTQCLKKNTDRCTKTGDGFTLTDRTGVKFPVKCDCVFCYNIVRNSVPLSLISEFPTIRRMGFSGIRLEFTSEDRNETRKVLQMTSEALRGRSPDASGQWTKGHFLRGAE